MMQILFLKILYFTEIERQSVYLQKSVLAK